jgi:hypothetical protein
MAKKTVPTLQEKKELLVKHKARLKKQLMFGPSPVTSQALVKWLKRTVVELEEEIRAEEESRNKI